MQTELTIYCFLIQAYAKLTNLFEKRMDSYANADARVSLEGIFPIESNNTVLVLYTTTKA
jgi:shikimate kinase